MRRYQKVYKKVVFHCLDMILLREQCYAIFKTIHKDRACHVFKQKFAEEIIEKHIKKVETPGKKGKIVPHHYHRDLLANTFQ